VGNFYGNDRRPPDASPLAEVSIAHQQPRLLGQLLTLPEVVRVVPATGWVEEKEGILNRPFVEAFVRLLGDCSFTCA